MSRSLWPCVIFPARYSGVYERGQWVALNEYNVPSAAIGDDIECVGFFNGDYENPIGVGSTPDAAYRDLVNKIRSDE